MTQIERRGNRNSKPTNIGILLIILMIAISYFVRNPEVSTVETEPVVKQEATAESVTSEPEPDKSNLPPLASSGSNLEKKKPTSTPKARATVTPTRQKRPTATVAATPTAKRSKATFTPTPRQARSQSGLPLIYYEDLPDEAHETIRLIDEGGPFPFNRDGIEFQNRERILPRRPRGYYREYTVITPGSNDRGARRIVQGENGELYYTDDHYDSFSEVVR